MNRLLSNRDIETALDGKCLVMEYGKLGTLFPQDMMKILKRAHGSLVLLYTDSPHLGHWVSVVKGTGPQEGRLFYTDPYGSPIDEPLDEMPIGWKTQSGQDIALLSHLLGATPKGIEIWYNQYPLQSADPNDNTCGRWALARCLMPFLGEKEFADMFRGVPGASPSQVVTAYTDQKLSSSSGGSQTSRTRRHRWTQAEKMDIWKNEGGWK